MPRRPAEGPRQQRQRHQGHQQPGAAPAPRQQQRGRSQAGHGAHPAAARLRPIQHGRRHSEKVKRHQAQRKSGLRQQRQRQGHGKRHGQHVGEMVGAKIGPAGAQAVLRRAVQPEYPGRSVHLLDDRIQAVQRRGQQQDAHQPFPAVGTHPRLRPCEKRRQKAYPLQRFPSRRAGDGRPGNAGHDVGRQERENPESGRNAPARSGRKKQRPRQHQHGPQKGNDQAQGVSPRAGGTQQPHPPGRRPRQSQQGQAVVEPLGPGNPFGALPAPIVAESHGALGAYHKLRFTSMMSSGSSRMSSSGVRSSRRAFRMVLTIFPPRLTSTCPLANSL